MKKYKSKYESEDIDRRLGAVDAKVGATYFDRESNTLYTFRSPDDKEAWLESKDEKYILGAEKFEFSGTVSQIKIENKMPSNTLYFTTQKETALITCSFLSQQKGITDTAWNDFDEDFLVTVSIDRGGVGQYEPFIVEQQVINGNDFTFDVRNILAVGSNRVKVTARGVESNAVGTLTYSVNLTSMYLAPSNFTWNTPFIEGQPYLLGGINIGGNLNKVLKIKVSNEGSYSKTYEVNIGANQYINTAYYFADLEFPTGGTGVYNVELWLDAESVTSEHLHYNIMCVTAAEEYTAQLVTISSLPSKIINYSDNRLFEYAVYNAGAATASPSVLVEATVNQNPVTLVNEVLKDVATGKVNVFETNIEIETEEIDLNLVADITLGECTQRAVYKIDNSLSYPPTSEYVFYMNAAQRNNAQDNREKIINSSNGQEISAEWTKMAWIDGVDGHTVDNEGRKCLFIPAHSKVVIDYSPLASVGNGKTLAFTFKVRNVADYNEPIITICDNPDSKTFKGIKITPASVILHSRDLNTSDLTQSIGYKDEEVIHCIITLIRNYKVTYGNLAQIYINGTKGKSFEFATNDDWTTSAKLTLGSNSSDLYVYSAMEYNKGFGKTDAERNYIASLPSSAEKEQMSNSIYSVCDDLGNIYYDAVKGERNVMVIEMLNDAELPHKGLSKEYSAYCNVEFSFIDLPREYKVKVWRFILLNCRIEGQGTTSMNYWLWNLRFRIDKSGNIAIIYPDNSEQIVA